MNLNKVLLITSEFPPQPGGLGNHAYNLANQLSKQKYDVTVLADLRSEIGKEERLHDHNLNFRVIRIVRYRFILTTYLKRVLVSRKLIKNEDVSLVIASGRFSMWLAIYGLNYRCLKKIAIVHGSEINSHKYLIKKLTDAALRKFDIVIPVSHFTKSLINHLDLKRVEVVHNGIDLDSLKPSSRPIELKGSPKLVTVGTLSERKGQSNIISKLPALITKYPNIHYHMIGIPLEMDGLKRLAKSLNIDQHITFHGVISTTKMLSILKICDIFVMLSNKTDLGDVEGFGIALLEANYMKTPTIGATDCGIEDAIDKFKSGILVHPKNCDEFVNAVEQILSKKEWYKKKSYDWALKHSWRIIIKRYLEIIESL